VWGPNDPIFPEPGAHAYLADLPQAELLIAAFLDRVST
jgi:hypothetical protein